MLIRAAALMLALAACDDRSEPYVVEGFCVVQNFAAYKTDSGYPAGLPAEQECPPPDMIQVTDMATLPDMTSGFVPRLAAH